MNPPDQPGAGTLDGDVCVRRVSVTESGAQSANFACHPGDRSLHVSLTSSDGTISAVLLTLDDFSHLPTSLGGGTVSIMAAHAGRPSANGTNPAPIRHRLHLRHFHHHAPSWDAPAEPWR